MTNQEKSSCFKCGYESETNPRKFGTVLCEVCVTFAPNNIEDFRHYVNEKINKDTLSPFRRYTKNKSETLKKGMIDKAKQGQIVSRAPFGYILQNKRLIPDLDNFHKVEEIFDEFLNSKISLNQLANKYSFSVNGIKKILSNFTYIGKTKFNGEVHQGNHKPAVSSTLFNHVQNKLKIISKKTNA